MNLQSVSAMVLGLVAFSHLSAAPALAATAAPAGATIAAWTGTYDGEVVLPRDASGVAPFMNYRLAVTPGGCQLKIEGTQTDETLVCMAKPSAQGLVITFKSYPGGKTSNQYDVAVYKVGQQLLTLSRAGTRYVALLDAVSPTEKRMTARFTKKK